MKPTPSLLSLALCLLLLTCSTPDCGCVQPMASFLMGRWEWLRTVTPTRTITPKLAGYTRILQHANDNRDYVAFFRNDSLYLRLNLTSEIDDAVKNTVLESYVTPQGGPLQIKYFLTGVNSLTAEMQTSDPATAYTERADTVRHFYRMLR